MPNHDYPQDIEYGQHFPRHIKEYDKFIEHNKNTGNIKPELIEPERFSYSVIRDLLLKYRQAQTPPEIRHLPCTNISAQPINANNQQSLSVQINPSLPIHRYLENLRIRESTTKVWKLPHREW